jgi:hypothetical protein
VTRAGIESQFAIIRAPALFKLSALPRWPGRFPKVCKVGT